MNPFAILLGVFLIVVGIYLHFYYQGRFAKTEEAKQAVADIIESLPSWFVKAAPTVLVIGGTLRLYLELFVRASAA
jgi:uncharacterized membrane protein YidH (DUF202 family)